MAGVVGLLAALAITLSGCYTLGNAAGNPNVAPSPSPTPKVKISDLQVIEDDDFEGWNSMDGEVDFKWSAADKANMGKNAKAIFTILFEDHPEYTVEGFKPTMDTWNNEIAPKLQPLTTSSAWPKYAGLWMKDVPASDGRWEETETEPYESNPFLTNHPELVNGDHYPGYDILRSWKSKSGEQCSPSDQPYNVDNQAVTATTRPEGDSFASAYPILTVQLEVTIHCKEGGKLKYGIHPSIMMKKEHGEWLLDGTQIFTGSAMGPAEKIEK